MLYFFKLKQNPLLLKIKYFHFFRHSTMLIKIRWNLLENASRRLFSRSLNATFQRISEAGAAISSIHIKMPSVGSIYEKIKAQHQRSKCYRIL
jgi:hypothetical protein